jgi:hypothetical protein
VVLTAVVVSLFGLALGIYNITMSFALRQQAAALQQASLSGLASEPWRYIARSSDAIQKPVPPVVWSVVKFRPGEQESLQSNLVGPLLADSLSNGPEYSTVLIERKVASSKQVTVRLFLKDGTEQSYLWPLTHASKEGTWTVAP